MSIRMSPWVALVAVAGCMPGISAAGSTPASVTLATSTSTPTFGRPVTLTASATPPVATGKMTFFDGTTILGIQTLSKGQAALTTTLLPAGKRALRAYYGGDSTYAANTSAIVTVTVSTVAENGFSTGVYYPTGNYVSLSIAVGDLNGDDKPDLVLANEYDSSISVLLGNGDGTFQPAVNYPVYRPGSTAIGDFNGDGIPDLAVICEFDASQSVSGENLTLFFGKGDGTFQIAGTDSAGITPTAVLVADFNGDGIPDLAVANSGSNNVSILMGSGYGVFKNAVNIPVALSPTDVITGDFNGDGQIDLAVTTSVGVALLHGHGDGTFDPPVYVGGAANAVVVGEFNGDGIADLILGTQTGVGIFLGQANAAPSISSVGLVNAASLQIGAVAPGSQAIVYGNFLGDAAIQLGSGISAPVLAVVPGQATIQVPWELAGQLQSTITVTSGGQTSAPQTVRLATDAPGLFSTNGQGTGQGQIFDSSGRLVDASNPAAAGTSIVRIMCTGLGPVGNQPPTGAVTPASPPSVPLIDQLVTIGSLTAIVTSSGLVPGTVGQYELDVLVPASVFKGPNVQVTIKGANTVTMSVQ